MCLVRKFLGKLLDYNNGDMFNDVWLIDWDNDCCDDCWTLTLGLELSVKEKAHLIECGEKFSVVDPKKLGIEMQQAGPDTIVKPVVPVQNLEATVSESRRKRTRK